MLELIEAPNAPEEFSVVLRATEKLKVNSCLEFCYKRFGKPIDYGRPGIWYFNHGYFFFRSYEQAVQVLVAMNEQSRGRPTRPTLCAESGLSFIGDSSQGVSPITCESDPRGPANVLIARVHNAYPVE